MHIDNAKEAAKARLRARLRLLQHSKRVVPPTVQRVEPNFRTACVLNPDLNKPKL